MITAPMIAAAGWLAFGGVADATATARFEPTMERELVGFEDVDFDSGWVPASGPVQLRFYAHAADSISIEMLGDGVYDWDAQSIAFLGDVMAGIFAIDVGLELQASVRFDVAGIQWESDILGPWDYAIISDALYTPYLLSGNDERPVEIQDQTDGVTIASVPIVPDIIVASGNLDIDVAADISASLEGIRIEATADEDSALVEVETSPSPLMASDGVDPLMVEGVLVANIQTEPVLIVRPHLVMSILGQEFEIIGIDIPIALPPTDEQLEFDPELMLFDAPEPPPSGDSGGADETGDEGVADDDGTGDGESTGGGESSTGDTDGAPACCDTPTGCGCRGSEPTPVGALMLLLMAVGLRTRRDASVGPASE